MADEVTKKRQVICLVGPKDEPLLYFANPPGLMMLVYYEYRRTPELYCVTNAKHTKDGTSGMFCTKCKERIPLPKRGVSNASQRRVLRHLLSHHRRYRTLLPWFDGLKREYVAQIRRLADPSRGLSRGGAE